jgi:hypothetical protein
LLYDRVTLQLDCKREPFEGSGGVHFIVGECKGLFRVFAIGLLITNEYNVVVLISTFPTTRNCRLFAVRLQHLRSRDVD